MHLSRNLIHLIEQDAESLARRWLEEVRRHPGTPTYHRWDERQLYTRVYRVYRNLGRSISHPSSRAAIEAEYRALGRQRYAEGFAITEVILALVITKRVLWSKVQAEGFLDTALDLNNALDLYNLVALFFDRATYFTAKGFEEACRTAKADPRSYVAGAHQVPIGLG